MTFSCSECGEDGGHAPACTKWKPWNDRIASESRERQARIDARATAIYAAWCIANPNTDWDWDRAYSEAIEGESARERALDAARSAPGEQMKKWTLKEPIEAEHIIHANDVLLNHARAASRFERPPLLVEAAAVPAADGLERAVVEWAMKYEGRGVLPDDLDEACADLLAARGAKEKTQ